MKSFNKYICFYVLAMLGFTIILVGCAAREDDIVIEPVGGRPDEEDAGYEDEWALLSTEDAWEDERMEPRFVEKNEAINAPNLNVKDESGVGKRLRLRQKDGLLLVVFWSMDSWITTSAAAHAQYLMDNYGDYGLQVIGIIENPDTYQEAGQFLDANDITYENYYDDFTALKRMETAVNRDISTALPCFFIIDTDGKIRLSKVGFSPSGVIDDIHDSGSPAILENAPHNERIEDYLRRLIREAREQT